jgi:hypothetical protein
MAITTYAELQTAIGNWLDHSLFTARIPEFITLFEACANRRLRVRQQETSTNLTPSGGSVALPSDYLSWRRVTWTGSTRVELEYVHPSYLQAAYPTSPAGVPHFFTVEGSTLKIRPIDDTPLEFDYFQKIPALASVVPADGTQTNWLLTAHPRPLSLRLARGSRDVRRQRRARAHLEGAPRRNPRRARQAQSQDPRRRARRRAGDGRHAVMILVLRSARRARLEGRPRAAMLRDAALSRGSSA